MIDIIERSDLSQNRKIICDQFFLNRTPFLHIFRITDKSNHDDERSNARTQGLRK